MTLGGSSVPGPRPYNEDNYLLTDLSDYRRQLGGLIAFMMVSDGMGGHSSGDVASRVAVETTESYLCDLLEMAATSDVDLDVPQALREMSEESHNAIVAAAAEQGAAAMGATFVAAIMSDTHAWVGHVGDSRGYLLSGGRAKQLTVDHSHVGRLIAEGVLTEEQAQHHPQRNVIERALGFTGATADVTEVDLHNGDALVLCSDGVSTVLTGEDMVAIAAAASDPAKAATALTDEAVRAGTDDNATVVVWSDDWAAFRAASSSRAASPRRTSRRPAMPSRHLRAQRASLVIGGALVVVIAAVLGALWLTSKPATEPVATSSHSAPATGTLDATAPIAPLMSYEPTSVPKPYDSDGIWLRDAAYHKVGRLVTGVQLFISTETTRLAGHTLRAVKPNTLKASDATDWKGALQQELYVVPWRSPK